MEPPSSRREGAYPNRNDLLTEDFTSGIFPERAKTLEERGKRFPHGEEGSPSKKVHAKVVQSVAVMPVVVRVGVVRWW